MSRAPAALRNVKLPTGGLFRDPALQMPSCVQMSSCRDLELAYDRNRSFPGLAGSVRSTLLL